MMTGQTVDFFDIDFRELYAVSEQVNLYKEFNITKPPIPQPVTKPNVEKVLPLPVSMSRFQVSVGESRQIDLKVPAHKYHNPKYSLVFGNSTGLTGSLQDLSSFPPTESLDGQSQMKGPQSSLINTSNNVRPKVDQVALSPNLHTEEEEEEDRKGPLPKKNVSPGNKKPRSSFRHFLKGRGAGHGTETIEETVGPQTPAPITKVSNTGSVASSELEDSFEIVEKPVTLKSKIKKPSKLIQRSMSLQTINTGKEDGKVDLVI